MKNKQKYLAFLLSVCPVILITILVTMAIQNNSPVLKEIPDLLNLNVEAANEAPIESVKETTSSFESVAGQFKDGEYIGKGTGYGGTITVKVIVKNHSIASIKILDASKETASFFNRAKAVIDKVIKSQTWKVDVVSGATYSSKGILAAIQNALTGERVDTQTASTTEKKPINKEQFKEPDGYKDGTYTGSARGFGGNVSVRVTIKNGKIANIAIISSANETPSYFAKAKAVISRIIKSQTPNVDTVSGATYSSNGIINATKVALKKAAGDSSSSETPQQEEQPSEKESKKPSEKKQEVSKDGYKNGTYTGTARGYGGDIVVKVIVKKNKISSIASTVTKTISKLTSKKTYYVRACAYKKSGKTTVTGAYGAAKSVKVK